MHCVDAAASDAENRCKWYLVSLVDIIWKILFQNILNDSARRFQYATHVSFSQLTVEKELFIRVIEICCKSGLLVIKMTTLKRKIIQRSIFFEHELFPSSGFLHA